MGLLERMGAPGRLRKTEGSAANIFSMVRDQMVQEVLLTFEIYFQVCTDVPSLPLPRGMQTRCTTTGDTTCGLIMHLGARVILVKMVVILKIT